jgi:hypothetical protein
MIKLLFGMAVSVLLIVLAANLIAWLMPVLTHPVATVIFLAFFVLFARSAFQAGQK